MTVMLLWLTLKELLLLLRELFSELAVLKELVSYPEEVGGS